MEKMEEKHQKSDQDFHFSDSTMAIPRERKQKGEVDPAADCLKDRWGAFYVAVESTQFHSRLHDKTFHCKALRDMEEGIPAVASGAL
ncbi:Os08g0243833 [Oryza sativa Japonica Group]|uniref:Os08g0243833 protein n=1 Tax=Oryza sativa subsp. japonica TaxID=39947 RepID=A0A0P0XDJ7_ORYSJ|nr:Os08g0243833 [Oryza sativa Japonica Group]